MSLELSNSKPAAVLKTWGAIMPAYERTVFLDDYEITFFDFCQAMLYVLTNTDIAGNDDPRLAFIERVKTLEIAEGYDPKRRRIAFPVPASADVSQGVGASAPCGESACATHGAPEQLETRQG